MSIIHILQAVWTTQRDIISIIDNSVFVYCSPKFGQLILTKLIRIIATRCQISKPKCIKFDFGWGSGGERLSARPGLEPRPFWPRPRCSHAFSPPTLACLLILMQETNVACQHAVVQINVSFVSLDVWSRQIIAWNSISRARLQLLWQT